MDGGGVPMSDLDEAFLLGFVKGVLTGLSLPVVLSALRGRAILLPFLFAIACSSPLDLARRDFAASLRAANAAQMRFRTWDAQHQAEIVQKAKDRASGAKQLAEYRQRRSEVLKVAMQTEQVLDAVAEDLLVANAPQAQEAAERARQAAAELRMAVAKLRSEP